MHSVLAFLLIEGRFGPVSLYERVLENLTRKFRNSLDLCLQFHMSVSPVLTARMGEIVQKELLIL